VETVTTALKAEGFDVRQLGVGRDPDDLLRGLHEHRPDAVFNLFEGLADDGRTEASVAGLLEWLGVPFTGCPAEALCLARNKPLTKLILHGAGLPTPSFFVVNSTADPRLNNGHVDLTSAIGSRSLNWPMIVKAGAQDASLGIDHGSVVTSVTQLSARIALMLERYGPPVLVEQFIEGRELTVNVIEAPVRRTLPISEFVFRPREPGTWPIVTYDAKWDLQSRDYEFTPYCDLASVSPEMAQGVRSLALRAFGLLGMRDCGRIDFRVTPQGDIYILEGNPNPDFNPDAGLAAVLAGIGMTHAELVVQLVRQALERKKKAGVAMARR